MIDRSQDAYNLDEVGRRLHVLTAYVQTFMKSYTVCLPHSEPFVYDSAAPLKERPSPEHIATLVFAIAMWQRVWAPIPECVVSKLFSRQPLILL